MLKWTMVAQVKNVTAVVTAVIPEAVQEIVSDPVIRESFATLTVRDSVPLEENLAVLPFSLNQLAGFRIVRVQPGNAAMLTDGPHDAVEATEQPLLFISIMPAATQPQPEEREGVARRLLSEIPGLKDVRVTRSEPLRIANQQGYETLLEAKDAKTGTDVNAVQWLRFGSGTFLRMVGITRGDAWPKVYPRLREVTPQRRSVSAADVVVRGSVRAGRFRRKLGSTFCDSYQRRPQHAVADRITSLHDLDDCAGRH
jgi:hypothetical protein